MKIKSGFVIRSVGGENVVVPVGEMSKEFHGMITLNETGAFLWRFFLEERSVDEGVEALRSTYNVDDAVARVDVERFVSVLQENGFTV